MNPIKVTITLDMEQLKYMLNNNSLGIKEYVDKEFEHGNLEKGQSITTTRSYYGVPIEIKFVAPFYKYKKEGN